MAVQAAAAWAMRAHGAVASGGVLERRPAAPAQPHRRRAQPRADGRSARPSGEGLVGRLQARWRRLARGVPAVYRADQAGVDYM